MLKARERGERRNGQYVGHSGRGPLPPPDEHPQVSYDITHITSKIKEAKFTTVTNHLMGTKFYVNYTLILQSEV